MGHIVIRFEHCQFIFYLSLLQVRSPEQDQELEAELAALVADRKEEEREERAAVSPPSPTVCSGIWLQYLFPVQVTVYGPSSFPSSLSGSSMSFSAHNQS